MQDNFRTSSHFSHRVEKLADLLGCRVAEMPEKLGISRRMLFGYKSGQYRITEKTWVKLQRAEDTAGGKLTDDDNDSRTFRTDPDLESRVATLEMQMAEITKGLASLAEILQKPR